MDLRTAKDLVHIRDWLAAAASIVADGEQAYLSDPVRQKAGDSLMMKLGEAANRLAGRGVCAPKGMTWSDAVANRNFIIHQYDEIDREITWNTLVKDLPDLSVALTDLIAQAWLTVSTASDSEDRPKRL
jgi:uncharacterized protein with HEPN domain